MARTKGMLNLSGNLEVNAGAPLDARSIVPTLADLTVAANFQYKYIGMTVTVQATGDMYTLLTNDVTDIANWKKAGSGGGNINDETPTFTEAGTRANIASGEKISVIMGKIQKFFTDLKTVAFSGSYSDLSNKPTIPDELADLTSDSTHRLVTDAEKSAWSAKQNALTAGDNINISSNTISAIDTRYTAGTGINIENNVISATGGGGTSYTAGDGIDITNNVISVDEMASADMAEIVTPLPSVGARLPILFDEMGEERVVGWYRYSDGTKKKVYEKCFVDTMPSSVNTTKEISIGASIELCVSINASLTINGVNQVVAIGVNDAFNGFTKVSVQTNTTSVSGLTKNAIGLRLSASAWVSLPTRIVIQYTKTTDTPV